MGEALNCRGNAFTHGESGVGLSIGMSKPLSQWSADQIAHGRLWVSAWSRAGVAMEQVRRQELRNLDAQRAVALLCGPADYQARPRLARPSSGLIEQQRWFRQAAQHD